MLRSLARTARAGSCAIPDTASATEPASSTRARPTAAVAEAAATPTPALPSAPRRPTGAIPACPVALRRHRRFAATPASTRRATATTATTAEVRARPMSGTRKPSASTAPARSRARAATSCATARASSTRPPPTAAAVAMPAAATGARPCVLAPAVRMRASPAARRPRPDLCTGLLRGHDERPEQLQRVRNRVIARQQRPLLTAELAQAGDRAPSPDFGRNQPLRNAARASSSPPRPIAGGCGARRAPRRRNLFLHAAVPRRCGATYSCASGCPAGAGTRCGGACVDTDSDTSNCGGCGNSCTTNVPNAQPACARGACTITCSAGYGLCNAACADFANDPNNCGGCGSAFAWRGRHDLPRTATALTSCTITSDCPAGYARATEAPARRRARRPRRATAWIAARMAPAWLAAPRPRAGPTAARAPTARRKATTRPAWPACAAATRRRTAPRCTRARWRSIRASSCAGARTPVATGDAARTSRPEGNACRAISTTSAEGRAASARTACPPAHPEPPLPQQRRADATTSSTAWRSAPAGLARPATQATRARAALARGLGTKPRQPWRRRRSKRHHDPRPTILDRDDGVVLVGGDAHVEARLDVGRELHHREAVEPEVLLDPVGGTDPRATGRRAAGASSQVISSAWA